MKRWALVVVALYCLLLVAFTVPVIALAFVRRPEATSAWQVFLCWPYWLWLAVMGLSQAGLLVVPVSLANRRPVTRRPLILPILSAGLMVGGLAIGAFCSLCEFAYRDKWPGWFGWVMPALGLGSWMLWSLVFWRLSASAEPHGLLSRQCRLILKGSILELLIAVPTHIVARNRNYCCAGFMTFLGITLGISVMLFSFGPAVFFLYTDRWRRLHPQTAAE
jgi:hypothetical protein